MSMAVSRKGRYLQVAFRNQIGDRSSKRKKRGILECNRYNE